MMLRLGLALLLGFSTLAGADPAEDLKTCQAQAVEHTNSIQVLRRVRDYYAAQAAELTTQLEMWVERARRAAEKGSK